MLTHHILLVLILAGSSLVCERKHPETSVMLGALVCLQWCLQRSMQKRTEATLERKRIRPHWKTAWNALITNGQLGSWLFHHFLHGVTVVLIMWRTFRATETTEGGFIVCWDNRREHAAVLLIETSCHSFRVTSQNFNVNPPDHRAIKPQFKITRTQTRQTLLKQMDFVFLNHSID